MREVPGSIPGAAPLLRQRARQAQAKQAEQRRRRKRGREEDDEERFCMGRCKAQELKIERFANFIYSARFHSIGQELRSLRRASFHWELQRSRTEKREIWNLPTAMIVGGGNARKFTSFWGRGDSFSPVFYGANKHKPAAGAAAMPF